ncbi:MAG: NADH-quinone oxidoreductase subunit NuoH [Dehalococcoidia bacterium]
MVAGILLRGTIFNLPWNWLDAIVRVVIIVLLMTLIVLALTYLERKVIARIQLRLGPTRTGPAGLLQPIADAVKLLTKEDLRPALADRWVFELAPYFIFVPTFLGFVAVPFAHSWGVRILPLGVFYVLAVTSVSIVGWVMAGWGSDNKYALLGAVRAAAQMISYEIPLVLSVLGVVMIAHTLDVSQIVDKQGRIPYIVWQPLGFFIFLTAMLAELNRTPFDIPVAESEVAGGAFIEYSGIRWSMFQLSEYSSAFIYSLLGSALFLGGWNWPLGNSAGLWLQLILTLIKVSIFILSVFWFRASFPRLRIDQLMSFAWKVLIPLTFAQIFFNGLVLIYGWPDVFLFVFSGAALALTIYGVQVTVRNPERRPREERMAVVQRWQDARAARSRLLLEARTAQAVRTVPAEQGDGRQPIAH